MNTLRKGFYVIDMLLLLVVVFCINHTVVFTDYWPFVILDIAFLLRINCDILLYRKERWSILPILGFTLLFGVYYCSGIFKNTIFRMAEYPGIVLGTQRSDLIEPNIYGENILSGIFLWVWLMPVVMYLYQVIRKQTLKNSYRWYDIAGLAIFKDKVGQLFIVMGVISFIATLSGAMMDITLSKYSLLATPVAAYYFINRYVKRDPHWMEYVLLVGTLCLFHLSQFKSDSAHIAYLVAYAVIGISVCLYMLVKSKKLFASFLALLMITALPLLSLGYNIYSYTDGTRGVKYEGGRNGSYMYTRRSVQRNGDTYSLIGLRGRYHQVIPSKYRIIVPSSILSPFAKCITEQGDTVEYYLETGEIYDRENFK